LVRVSNDKFLNGVKSILKRTEVEFLNMHFVILFYVINLEVCDTNLNQ